MQPRRKKLYHDIPLWVADGAEYFITICCHKRGENQLCYDERANLLIEAFRFRQQRGDLWLHLLLLMPDHLHAIVSFSPLVGMEKCITDWKRYTARGIGVQWQRDFFDHRLRSDESHVEKAYYIRMNPVRAGYVSDSDKWKYVWENRYNRGLDRVGRFRRKRPRWIGP